MESSTLPAPLHIIQDSRYQDGWELDDISLCSSGNIAVSGHRPYRYSHQSYVCIYGSTVDKPDSRDKPTLLYHKQFTDKGSWPWRYISFIKPNSTEIVTCRIDEVQVIDYNREVVLRSRKVDGETWCLSVSESQIFVGLVLSDIVNIYDNDLNEIKSISLKGIRGYWPWDIAAAADRLYVCTWYHGRVIVYSQDSGNILTEYTTGQYRSEARSMGVHIQLGLTAVLWCQRDTHQKQIIFYLLSENKSFLTVNVESGVSRIRISEQGRIVTGNKDTGEVSLYNWASLFTYSRLSESLVSTLERDDCEKLADFFAMGGEVFEGILKSDRPASTLLLALEEKGVIQPSNVDKLEKAFLGLEMSPSFYDAVHLYQKLRDQITSYDRFLATLSAHLTSSVLAKLCHDFQVSDEQKDSIMCSQNPGLSLLLVLDEMGILKPSEVGCLETPFKNSKLVQALAKIDEYKEIVKEGSSQLPQIIPHSLEEKRTLFVGFLKKKIRSWFETMTPVPWKRSCQWKSTDLFVGSGLILTDSKAKQSERKIDEQNNLNYIEIFTHKKLKSEIRIILEGDPGTGKTMLLSKLAYDWSNGKIDGADILIFLPLKIVEDKTLIQAVKEFYIPTYTQLSENDIESILASDRERICVLLDGLEEYSTGVRMRAKESSEVMKIMKKEKHSNCKVVITCRSDFAHDLPECPILKLGRFGEIERNSYIEKLSPNNIDKQQKIKRIIQDNPFILDLCSIPLLFVLAVHNIESISLSEEGQLNKVSPFMRSMILTLCPSSTVKHEVDGTHSKFFRSEKMTLGKLAFNGLCRGHQQLSWKKDFIERNVGKLKVWVDSGILVLEEGLVISEKENQDMSAINKGEELKEKTKKEKRKGTPELPVLSEDMISASMGASKVGHEVSKIEKQHQSVSELPTEPQVMRKKTVRRAAGQVSLTVKFLHKVIQEWFAATFFCSMMRRCTSEDQFQNYVSSQLQHISPTDLHYVLRFTSYLHPPSCHVIMNYLLRSYRKDGSVPPYIMNCVFLCFNEHNDIKGSDMRNAVTDVSKEVIKILSKDCRLLQHAKSALLEYASSVGVIIEKLEVEDIIFAVNDTLTLKSGVQLEGLDTVKAIKVGCWDKDWEKVDNRNILKILSTVTLLKEICCDFPKLPPSELDTVTLENFSSKDLKVEWHTGPFVHVWDSIEGEWNLDIKQPADTTTRTTLVITEQDEKQMQQTLTSCLPGTGTESSVQSSKSQRPQKQYGSDSVLEADVPEKREKVSEGKIPFGGVSHSQPTDCQRFLETNATITKNGGVIEIPNTGVVLMIPPDALPGCMKHLKIHMRITPRGEIIEQETSFSSNSSTVVQLFPCSLKFLRPVRLTLPHCLVLQGTGERKARIFTSRHKKGSGPEWEERTHLSYHLEDTACIILLDSLCWVKFSIDDEIVKAKKLTVYTALRKLQPQDEFAEVHIGYYVDLPEQKKVIEDNRDLIIKQRKSFNFIKTKEKYSLRISLENIYPNEQQFQALQPYLREITHRHIELFVNYSLLYHIGRKPSQAITPLCVFHVSQVDRKEAVQLTIHVKICSDEHNSQVAQSFPLDDYQECYISRKAISTKVGGMLEISNTGIVLGIPPNALPEDKESYEIQMRYIPKRTLKDQGEYSPSYSTAVVEILPNLKLQYPVSLSLPHCLVLQQNIERKARIFGSHHDKGAHPFWEEQKDVSYHVEDTHCILLLNKFSWYTYLVDDEVVKAKKMVVYAAAQKFQSCDDVVRIEIGCYPDLPVRDKEIHRGQNLHIAHTKTLYFVKREEQYPLRISLNDIFPSEWRCRCCCRFPDTHTQEISYRNIWVGLGGSCVYILERTGRTLVWPLCVFTASQEKGYTAVQLAVNFQVMGKVSSTTGSKDNQSESLLKAETIITKAGGELKIEGTGVVLKISPNALKGNNENQLVQMRIIPSRLIEDQVTPFSSNSCTAVEIFPNNIRLRKPAELRLPHCLMLNKIRDRAARILINYQKGSPAIWEEDKNVPHTLDESACMIKLKTFCCVKYYIDDTSVMGKKIRVYTAAREVEENDEVAEVEIGYCPDIPGVGELLRMNPSFTVDSVEKLLFLEKIKSPLQLSLEDISSSQWTCWFPKDKPWDIPFEVVASSIEHSHLFILQKTNEGVGSVICRFTAVQKEGEMAIMLALTVRPKVTQDFDGRATGHAFQEHRKKLKADSGNLTIKLLSRKLREEWKDVCRKLGVEEGKLYREEADNKGNLKEAIYQCLLSWKEDKGDKATFESLRVALVENERSDLAEDITKYEELF